MSWSVRVGCAVGLLMLGVGLGIFSWFLTRQHVSGAAAWATIASLFVSGLSGVAAAVFAWLAWRYPRSAAPGHDGSATASGDRSAGVVHGGTVVTEDGNIVSIGEGTPPRPNASPPDGTAPAGRAQVTVTGCQGVQIGDHNAQTNTFRTGSS